jgi:hypothetical protein
VPAILLSNVISMRIEKLKSHRLAKLLAHIACVNTPLVTLSSRKMFHLILKKMFVFTTTFKLFVAETRVTEMRQVPKISPLIYSRIKIALKQED